MTKENGALILVDLQNDFCKGGSLAVPDADSVIPVANRLQSCFDCVVATKDWHPKDHVSFVTNHKDCKVGDIIEHKDIQQVIWPKHCVQGSKGAEFHKNLNADQFTKVIPKGTDACIDSYSAFFDNAHCRSTGLSDYLNNMKINTVYVAGLATDYCVKYTVLDALSLGLTVNLVIDACRGVDLVEGDVERALEEMQRAGARLVHSTDFIAT